MGMYTFFRLCVFITMVAVSLTCTCPPETPWEKFCNRDFGLMVRVNGQIGLTTEARTYDMDVVRIYHRRPVLGFLFHRRLLTPPHSSTCGFLFDNGLHVVSGNIVRRGWFNFYQTTTCDFKSIVLPPSAVFTYQPPSC